MIQTEVKYIAVGNDGMKHFLRTRYPRKELLEFYGRKHADRMYIDGKKNEPLHIGYIIAGVWITLYAVEGRGPREKGVANA